MGSRTASVLLGSVAVAVAVACTSSDDEMAPLPASGETDAGPTGELRARRERVRR
jgi:hypothetical protein